MKLRFGEIMVKPGQVSHQRPTRRKTKPEFVPISDFDDKTSVTRETELATALNLLINEIISPDTKSSTLDKVSFLNEIQVNGMVAFESLRVLGGGIPQRASVLTDAIKRLSQSKKGVRAEQIKEMVIGQKNQPGMIEKIVQGLGGAKS